jgi:hypothetical protein
LIPAIAEPTDRRHQLGHAGEVATAQGLALDDRKGHLDTGSARHAWMLLSRYPTVKSSQGQTHCELLIAAVRNSIPSLPVLLDTEQG